MSPGSTGNCGVGQASVPIIGEVHLRIRATVINDRIAAKFAGADEVGSVPDVGVEIIGAGRLPGDLNAWTASKTGES